jgi:hypothetical protein
VRRTTGKRARGPSINARQRSPKPDTWQPGMPGRRDARECHLSSCTIVVSGSTGAEAHSRLGHWDLCEPSQPVRAGRKQDWCTSSPPLTSIRVRGDEGAVAQ